MRLRSVWINAYKNLRDFSINFEGDTFIDIFVGRNGSGKSNFLEALIEIFDHLFDFDADAPGPGFDYTLSYEIDGGTTSLEWRDGGLTIDGTARRTIGRMPLPDHLLVHYSGQNDQVGELVQRYERSFRDDLRKAQSAIAPCIIGIGPACKKLLIVTLLLLSEESLARQFLLRKLGILNCLRNIRVVLSRPHFVDTDYHDPFDDAQLFWGVAGYARIFLQHLLDSIEGGFTPGQLYDRERGHYTLTCNIDRLREAMGDASGERLFRSFDALRVLGMLRDIGLPVALEGLEVSDLGLFSDGQYQSVYLFGISELFKGRNCVTLLDEPDAFLHPEWQFDFLKQVHAISGEAAATNHIVLSSHSASTIAADTPGRIRMFSLGENGVELLEMDKAELVKSLSAGLITFSEREATLNIEQLVANTTRSVLFTEGVSDVEILKIAWTKLFLDRECPFEIIQCFDSGHLRKQMVRQELYQGNAGRKFFALFDFDNAYGDWAAVGGVKARAVANGALEENDVARGLVCKRPNLPGYAMLLPVPARLSVRHQVCNPNSGQTYGDASRLTIELLFRDVPGLEDHFAVDPDHPAMWTRFIGNKVAFAQQVVPTIAAQHFEPFRPIYDFILAKIAQP
jgi:predicted ATPase